MFYTAGNDSILQLTADILIIDFTSIDFRVYNFYYNLSFEMGS